MTRQETLDLQYDLDRLGYYSGPIDGIYGPLTKRAYDAYITERHIEISVPILTPEPADPWWVSRGIWGALLVLAALPLKALLGIEYEPSELLDVVMPVVEQIPVAMTAIGGLLAWWGRKNAKAPIDPTLMARVGTHDLRLPRLRREPLPTGREAGHKDPRGLFGE